MRIGKEAEVSEFFGQELNRTTYNLARMNMILHGVHFRQFDIKQDDTLEHPQHLDVRFEAVVANPPFSARWKGKDNPLNETDDRFSQYGRLAPTTKADFAFVQHMIYQMAENATMAVVLPHGVLFRGAAEEVDPKTHHPRTKLSGCRNRITCQPVLRHQYSCMRFDTEEMPGA